MSGLGDFADIGFDFSGYSDIGDYAMGELGEAKPKKPAPELPPPLPTPKPTSEALLPKWVPLGVAAVGIVIVVGILLTSKGKD